VEGFGYNVTVEIGLKEQHTSQDQATPQSATLQGGIPVATFAADQTPAWLGSNAHVNESARLYTNPFEATEAVLSGKEPLYKSLAGRVFTQSIARGVVGAAFFTAGCYMLKVWQPGVDIKDQHILAKAPEALSRLFDATVTKAVSAGVALAGNSPEQVEQIMTFNKFHAKPHMLNDPNANIAQIFGMTMGQEMVDRTWQFAAGSIGAALGRNLVAAFDPNVKKTWLKDGEIDFKQLAKSSLKQAWTIISYHQGEDWFAAPFYVWQVRAVRGGMDGGLTAGAARDAAMWDFQNGGNGASERVNLSGTPPEMCGSLQGTGAMDFQTRFMGYNFYTLLYRDLYNHLGHTLNQVKERGVDLAAKLPDNPLETVTHGAAEATKYLMKTFVKSQIYMAPAMLAFWPQRVSMGRQNHMLIDENTGQLITTQPTRAFDPTDPAHLSEKFIENGLSVPHAGIAARASDIKAGNKLYSAEKEFVINRPDYDPYVPAKGGLDQALAPLGRAQNAYAGWMNDRVAQPVAGAISNLTGMDGAALAADAKWAANTFVGAQTAYMPYMTMKYETAQLYDTPKADAAIYTMLDGAFAFDGKKFWSGLKDIGNVITFQPLSDETQAHMGEKRGLVNSRFEAQCKGDAAQVKLKVEDYIDKKVKKAEAEGIHIPESHVKEMKHEGVALAVAIQDQRNAAKNNIKPFTRKESIVDGEHAARLAQQSTAKELVGASVSV
jgi:hypothetical protein